jgi:phage shock protein A|tara:strand:+ start:436 stop:588 length:153 start_codon:yes stop_codon:yes gene_type:complete
MEKQVEIKIGEFDRSIIQLQKHKFKLLEQVEQINLQISFLRQQQEQLINV